MEAIKCVLTLPLSSPSLPFPPLPYPSCPFPFLSLPFFPSALDRPISSLLSVSHDLGASEEWLETSSMSSRSGIEDGMSIGSGRSDAEPKYCIALYDYSVSIIHAYTLYVYMCVLVYVYYTLRPSSPQAQRPDELTIRTDEELEVLEWDDGDGWSKGRNHSGKEGYFPQTYVRAVSPSSSPRSSSIQQIQDMMNSHLTGPLQELSTQVI